MKWAGWRWQRIQENREAYAKVMAEWIIVPPTEQEITVIKVTKPR